MAPVGRDELISALTTDVSSGCVLLTGPRGSGRTTVLEAITEQTRARCATVAGRERHEGVPFGPWSRLLSAYDARLDAPLTIYTELPRRIAADVDLLLLDDLDLFDPASAMLTAQLARTGLRIIATAESGRVPDALHDSARRWQRRELPALSGAELEAVAAQIVGLELSAPAASRLVAWSSGRVGVTVALVTDALAAGRVRHTPGGARIDDPVVGEDVLAYLGIDTSAIHTWRALLQLVAVADGLPRTVISDVDLDRLSAAGLVMCVGDQVQPVAPAVAAWALGELSADQRRHCYQRAADLVRAHDPLDRRARLLDACAERTAPLATTTEAAGWLADRGRLLEAAALLARTAIRTPGDEPNDRWEWQLMRARVQRDLGNLSAAADAVDLAVEHASGDAQLVRLVSEWAAVHGGGIDEDVALEERINRVLPLLVDDDARASVRAMLSRRRAILGARGPRDSEQSDDPINRLLREAMGGSLEFAREHFIPPSDEEVTAEEDIEELQQILGRFLGLVYNGDLVEGRAEAEARHQSALDAALPSLGLWSYNRTKIAFHAGQYGLAVVRGREMRRHLAWRDVAGQRLPGTALLAAAQARDGQLEEAQRLIATLSDDERALPRVLIGARRVEAEALLVDGDRATAADLLHGAGQYALSAGEGHTGLLAIDEAFMIDPAPAHAAALRALADQSAIAAVAADRAEAYLAGEAPALEAAAALFAAMPLPGRAVQAWEWAADLHSRAGRSEAARRCAARAVLLASEHALAPWPDRETPRLTGRELEIARLAAERNRSREIADQLGLSVRTVDNHLSRVFRKLGVSRREELGAVLGGTLIETVKH